MKKLVLITGVLFIAAACTSKNSPVSQNQPQNANIGIQTFSSYALGLSFSYWQDGSVVVKEQGNKVQIYQSTQPDNFTKYIEVFKKDPNQTFSQAIKSQFLNGAPNSCQIQTFNAKTAFIPPAFDQQAKIVDSTQQDISQPNHCGDHSGSNGDSYFAYNTKYSDRFYFYDFGQDAWPPLNSDGSGDFRTTIKITPPSQQSSGSNKSSDSGQEFNGETKIVNQTSYTNTALNFQLTVPANWYIPGAEDSDPHFYNCPTYNCDQAFEIMRVDAELSGGPAAFIKSAVKDGSPAPVSMNNLIKNATVLRTDAPGAAEGWFYEYEIFFKDRVYVMFSSEKLDAHIFSSFTATKK